MPKRTSEGYGPVATEEPFMVGTEVEQKQGNGHAEVTQEDLVKLLATILHQVRSEAVLRPPPLPTLAERAIKEYGIMAGAMNPRRSPAMDPTAK
jgi:hypothetical protein